MSNDKFSRFMHLERSRGDKTPAGGQVKLQDGGRFESVAGPSTEAPTSVAVPEAHVERFKLHGQTPLALDDTSAPGQHFPRCVRCQTENGRFTQACTTCGADLQSPEQLAYDAERARAHQQDRLRQAEAQRQAEQQSYLQELNKALEADRSPAERFTRRLSDTLNVITTPSLGVGLLRLIPHPLARWMTLTMNLALPVLLVRYGSNLRVQKLGLYWGMFVVVSFVPSWLFSRRYRGW